MKEFILDKSHSAATIVTTYKCMKLSFHKCLFQSVSSGGKAPSSGNKPASQIFHYSLGEYSIVVGGLLSKGSDQVEHDNVFLVTPFCCGHVPVSTSFSQTCERCVRSDQLADPVHA